MIKASLKNQNRTIRILIPDGHNPMLAGVLQCLSDVKGVKIYLMAELWLLPVRLSRHVHNFRYFPPAKDPEKWIERVNEQTVRYSIDVILPVYVTAIRHLIEYRDKLEKPEALLLPPSLKAFDTANNKGILADFLKKHSIPAPRFWHLDPEDRAWNVKSMGPYPLMLKPTLDSGAGKGIRRFESPEALDEYLQTNTLNSPHLVQECIDGYDLGFDVLCKDGQILAYAMQKGFLFSKKAFAPQIGMDMVFNEKVYVAAEKIVKGLNWNGLANIDFRFDRHSGQFMILEINPRPWLTILGSNVAGVNFPWLYCKAVLGEKFEIPTYARTSFYTWQGLRIAILKNPEMFFRWGFIWKHSPVSYMLRDPMVTVLEFIRLALRPVKAGLLKLMRKIKP